MATENFDWGHIPDGNEVLNNVISPRPPFKKAACVMVYQMVVGTDFTSGNDLVIRIPGIDEIVYASVMDNVGGDVAYAEAAYTAGQGRQLTISAPTTNLKILIITDV